MEVSKGATAVLCQQEGKKGAMGRDWFLCVCKREKERESD